MCGAAFDQTSVRVERFIRIERARRVYRMNFRESFEVDRQRATRLVSLFTFSLYVF